VEHYPNHLSPQDYRDRAQARAAISPAGIGAAVERVNADRDGAPGRTWVCVVSDGSAVHYLDVRVADVPDYSGVMTTAVEDAVERAAERLPGPDRLAPLVAGGVLELDARDLAGG
jgi:hypothetical protein